jgi:hypothetical protein
MYFRDGGSRVSDSGRVQGSGVRAEAYGRGLGIVIWVQGIGFRV